MQIPKMEMVLFIGIQAVGKSEFCKKYFYKTHIRLNLDMLKTRHREKLLLEACITAKQPLVIDNTNPTANERQMYIAYAKEAGLKVFGFYFHSGIAGALERNSNRHGNEVVPDIAILATHKKLELPRYSEGFDELYYVSLHQSNVGEFIVERYDYEI